MQISNKPSSKVPDQVNIYHICLYRVIYELIEEQMLLAFLSYDFIGDFTFL